MKLLLTISALLGNTMLHAKAGNVPATGKFFYVDFPVYSTTGMHAIRSKIKQKNGGFLEYPLYVTFDEGSLALFNKKCPDK